MAKYQEPTFTVLKKDGAYELRRYQPFVSVATSDSTLRGSGFGRLFSFISGRNQAAKKMPMTIPVINDTKAQTMEFVLPIDMVKASDAPQPLDDQEIIKEYDWQVAAVVRFSGRSTETKLSTQEAMLKAWMTNHGYTPRQDPFIARYNAPMTPGLLRRNEIIIPIEAPDEA